MRNFFSKIFDKRKSFFGRIFMAFTAILVLNAVFAGVVLYLSLGGNITESKRQEMSTANIKLQAVLSNYLNDPDDEINYAMVTNYLFAAQDLTGAKIWLVDQNLQIRNFSTPPDVMGANTKRIHGRFFLLDRAQFDNVVKKGNKGLIDSGDFYNLFSKSKYKYFTTAFPMHIISKDNANDVRTYVLYMFLERPGMMESQRSSIKLYLLSSVFSTVLAMLLIFVWSRRMSRPIVEMSEAANKIASGQYGRRVDERYPLEFGDLAHNFNVMAESIERVKQTRKDFIANVSHDLRTPMTSMRGFIDAILDGTIPQEKQAYYLTIVRDEIVRLNNLTNELLDYSRIEAGKYELNIEPFDINELVKKTVISLEHLAHDKFVHVIVNLHENDQFVLADKHAVERVLVNLISNAVKFVNHEGNIVIDVSKMKRAVLISVSDDGPGISEEDKKQIFDRFYKTDKSRGVNKQGVGLGLSIVKSIIEAHEQKVWVDSEVGKGSTFYFTLKPLNK